MWPARSGISIFFSLMETKNFNDKELLPGHLDLIGSSACVIPNCLEWFSLADLLFHLSELWYVSGLKSTAVNFFLLSVNYSWKVGHLLISAGGRVSGSGWLLELEIFISLKYTYSDLLMYLIITDLIYHFLCIYDCQCLQLLCSCNKELPLLNFYHSYWVRKALITLWTF